MNKNGIIHGIATFKDRNDFLNFGVKSRTGLITAYLPERNIFAVHFQGEGQLITFHDHTEDLFKDRFDVILDEDIQNPFNSYIQNLISLNNYGGYDAFWNNDWSDGFLLVADKTGYQQKFNFIGEKII